MVVISLKGKAWIGDAILARWAREFRLRNKGEVGKSRVGVIVSNVNLQAYALDVLKKPLNGTGVEAYIYDVETKQGCDAARDLCYDICYWTIKRLTPRPQSDITQP